MENEYREIEQQGNKIKKSKKPLKIKNKSKYMRCRLKISILLNVFIAVYYI